MALDRYHPIIDKEILADKVVITSSTARCEGEGVGIGHPAVYLHVEPGDTVQCPYCSRSFYHKAS